MSKFIVNARAALVVLACCAGCGSTASSSAQSAAPSSAQTPARNPLADFPQLSATADWPWWRGPRGDGHAAPDAAPPTVWSDEKSVVWKTPVPGRGHSSPTIVGGRIFLSTADEKEQTQSVLAFDEATGRPLWNVELSRGGFPKTHRNNTHATPTVASDGERLFVTFHHHDTLQAVALDFAGKIVWNQSLGEFHPRRYEYGYAPSPVLYRDTVIVAAEFDGPSFITALDRRTGAAVWRIGRPNNTTFSSPALVRAGGRDLLAITGGDQMAAYDPADGKTVWSVAVLPAATCGTIVTDGDLLFASGGYPRSETAAVRATGSGGEVVWKNGQQCYEQSMIVIDGYLYALTDNGVYYCFHGTDGREMWKKRLRGPVSASPVYAGGHIYWANEHGTTYVLKPNPAEMELIAENQLGDESYASPAVVGKRMYVRVATSATGPRQEYLYCLGE